MKVGEEIVKTGGELRWQRQAALQGPRAAVADQPESLPSPATARVRTVQRLAKKRWLVLLKGDVRTNASSKALDRLAVADRFQIAKSGGADDAASTSTTNTMTLQAKRVYAVNTTVWRR